MDVIQLKLKLTKQSLLFWVVWTMLTLLFCKSSTGFLSNISTHKSTKQFSAIFLCSKVWNDVSVDNLYATSFWHFRINFKTLFSKRHTLINTVYLPCVLCFTDKAIPQELFLTTNDKPQCLSIAVIKYYKSGIRSRFLTSWVMFLAMALLNTPERLTLMTHLNCRDKEYAFKDSL